LTLRRSKAKADSVADETGERGGNPAAEGATAPESLRQKDRTADSDTLERAPENRDSYRGRRRCNLGNCPLGPPGGKALRFRDRGGTWHGVTRSRSCNLSEISMGDDDRNGGSPCPLDATGTVPRARGWCEFAGYAMPVQYEGIIAEHLWTRENAGPVRCLATWASLSCRAKALLQRSRNWFRVIISALKEGRPRYSLLLSEDGGVLDDLMVTRCADSGFMSSSTARYQVGRHRPPARNLPTNHINHLEDSALLALQGPKAFEALAACRGGPLGQSFTFMKGGSVTCGSKCRWDQPFGLYRRGRVRDLGIRRCRRGACRRCCARSRR
jgi:hypothetical protein